MRGREQAKDRGVGASEDATALRILLKHELADVVEQLVAGLVTIDLVDEADPADLEGDDVEGRAGVVSDAHVGAAHETPRAVERGDRIVLEQVDGETRFVDVHEQPVGLLRLEGEGRLDAGELLLDVVEGGVVTQTGHRASPR